MKKIYSIMIVAVLIILSFGGCSKKKTILVDERPYIIINSIDRKTKKYKRIEFRVYLKNVATNNQMKDYGREIVKEHQNLQDAILVLFYDIESESLFNNTVPLGVATWGPEGKFKINESTSKSSDMLFLELNTVNHKISDEEKDVYNIYLKHLNIDKDLKIDSIIDELGVSKDEATIIIDKVRTRYNPVINIP